MVYSDISMRNGVTKSTENSYFYRQVASVIPTSFQPSGTIKTAKIGNINFLHYLRERYAIKRQLSNNPGTNLHSETTTQQSQDIVRKTMATTRRGVDSKCHSVYVINIKYFPMSIYFFFQHIILEQFLNFQ